MKILAILTVRNEASFLLEWLAHHRAAGVTDFLVFSNDCTDGTDAMLDRLADLGWLTHLRNDGPHDQGPQWAALRAADRHPLVAAADWIMFIDVDEFVNVHVGARTLPDLIAALPDAGAIVMTWRMFGNAGIVQYSDSPVTETFRLSAPDPLHWPWRALMYKTLFRNDGRFDRLGVHRPKGKPRPDQGWYDGSGQPLPDGPPRIFSAPGGAHYGLVQLNHYALGSMEGYVVKSDRGRANREASVADIGYWVERNFCAVEENSILQLDSRSIRAGLMADEPLAELHRAGVAWRKARFAELMRDENWRAFFSRLMMAPPSRILSPAQARLIWSHGLPAKPAP